PTRWFAGEEIQCQVRHGSALSAVRVNITANDTEPEKCLVRRVDRRARCSRDGRHVFVRRHASSRTIGKKGCEQYDGIARKSLELLDELAHRQAGQIARLVASGIRRQLSPGDPLQSPVES